MELMGTHWEQRGKWKTLLAPPSTQKKNNWGTGMHDTPSHWLHVLFILKTIGHLFLASNISLFKIMGIY